MTTIVAHRSKARNEITMFADTQYSQGNGSIGRVTKMRTGANYLIGGCGNMAVAYVLETWVEGNQRFPDGVMDGELSREAWLLELIRKLEDANCFSPQGNDSILVATHRGNYVLCNRQITREMDTTVIGSGSGTFNILMTDGVNPIPYRTEEVLNLPIHNKLDNIRAAFERTVVIDHYSSGFNSNTISGSGVCTSVYADQA